jgi:hypothetical protein
MRGVCLAVVLLAALGVPGFVRAEVAPNLLAQAEEMASAFLVPRGLARDSFQPPQASDQMGTISVLWLPKDFKSPWSLVTYPNAKLICRVNRLAPPQERPDCDSGYATPQRMIPQILPSEKGQPHKVFP